MISDAIEGSTRAAALLLTLDEETAAAVLGQLDPEVTKNLGLLADQVRPPSPDELMQTLLEFEQLMKDPTPVVLGQASRFLKSITAPLVPKQEPAELPPPPESPIGRLRHAQVNVLASMLAEEHPQVAAAIFSQLGPGQAAKVLNALPELGRADVLGRLATLEKVPRAVVEEASQALADALAEVGGVGMDGADDRFDGKHFAAQLLKELSDDQVKTLLDSVQEQYGAIAGQLREAMFSFEDLLELSAVDLQQIMREVPAEQLVPALKTASQKLVDKMLAAVSSRVASAIREDLASAKPMRLSDVEKSQREVIMVVQRLAEDGRIQLPRKGKDEMV